MRGQQPSPTPLMALISRWRSASEVLREYGATEQACAVERCTQDALAAMQQSANEALTPAQAAEASGLTPDAITRLVRQEKLTNVGKKGRPLVLRRELPRKARVESAGLVLLPSSANSATVAPDVTRAAIGAKLPGGRRM
jgi:hypothetical protein